ncbi:hypothetical protein [Chelatococcus reniformis]|uniref:Uncharacterized protein n=1 Tax=Chelatococcus reniformis TaxID=1494448 RepID=A0A916UZ04_9HYPH|nr:hypothetical protein [Chelatococcus reniformis]GGC94733.1 hypothetical protein GCM10010994_60590 [Chelatococcus reniformis]
MRASIVAPAAVALALVAVPTRAEEPPANSRTYTLYRKSTVDPNERVHWATFNADQSGSYNQTNCELAARLLNINLAQANGAERVNFGVFWCELGNYRP